MMNILPLVPDTDLKATPSLSYSLDRKELADTLINNMIHHNGVGLSACQLGIDERVFVFMHNGLPHVMFDPRITKYSSKVVVEEEGCLSFPGLGLMIPRSYGVCIRWEDENKKRYKSYFTGFTARILQHEYDHLEGIEFTKRVKNYSKIQSHLREGERLYGE